MSHARIATSSAATVSTSSSSSPRRMSRAPRALPADRRVEVGHTLGPSPNTGRSYALVERLGVGSSAETFRASPIDASTDDATLGDVAVKTLTLRGRRADGSRGFKAVELFERECGVLQALNHPSIPSYVDHFEIDAEDDVRYVLVQRLARGRNLQQRLETDKWRPTEAQVIGVLTSLLETLAYASSLRPPVIHRDVKPANVVMDPDTGAVSLVDFGATAAAAMDSDGGGNFGSTIVGTLGFMAPEQLIGGTSPKTDQYGVGATVLYLLSGRAPSGFKTERLKINFDDVYIEDARLRAVLERLLEPSPEDRFDTPRDAIEALTTSETNRGGGAMISGRNFRRTASAASSYEMEQMAMRERAMAQQQQLMQPIAPRGAKKPKNMTTTVTRGEKSITIAIPASGANGDVLYKAFFGVTWTGITALWTAGVLASGAWLMAAFSLPFWKVGADLTGEVVRNFVAEGNVFIDEKNFRVASEGGGMKFLEKVGETSEIEAAYVRPDGLMYLKLEDDSIVPILAALSRREAEYIASEINALVDSQSDE
jgi:serine/threonine protein kinase